MAGFEEIRRKLEAVGQTHVLTFVGELTPAQQRSLLAQIAAIDLGALPGLVEAYVRRKPTFALPAGATPAPYYTFDATSPRRAWDRARYAGRGEELLRGGRVAAFVVAGGQGSRLGFEGPKGCFPGGAVTGKPLFQIFAEQVLAAGRRYGRAVPWYIMTSPLNHDATREFLEGHGHFGLDPRDVMMFPQGVMPSLDVVTGRMLMASKGELATNPDGHGGSIRALHVSGALDDMERRGIEHLSYFQVDNPTVRIIDPAFLGLHAAAPESSGEMSSKMIPKASPEEKLGVFCSVGGRIRVIEYSDLPGELARQRAPDGSLRFAAGSIAIHVIGTAFLRRLNADAAFALGYHRAEKKVACIDPERGTPIRPEANNAVKLERFVFDALPLCRGSIVLETDRVEEFAPIKNGEGVDSVESSRALQTERAARWLARAGVRIPRREDGSADCVLEISPLTATDPEDLRGKVGAVRVERGARLAI